MKLVKSVFSGPYSPAFGLHTERYGVSDTCSPNVGKNAPEITPYLDTFHAVMSVMKDFRISMDELSHETIRTGITCWKIPGYVCNSVCGWG